MLENNQAPAGEVLTIPQAAAVLGCNRLTVWRMLRRGELAGYRTGRVFRVRRIVVEEFIARQERAAAERAA